MYPEHDFDVKDSRLNKGEHLAKSLSKRRLTRREKSEWAPVKQSQHSLNTVNPIRKIVDAMSVPSNPEKKEIKLHLGDPTLTGALLPAESVVKAIHDSVNSHRHDGYGPAVGELAARQAVVDKYNHPMAPITADDVILASGCSHALQLAIEAIADPGDNILVPSPGFPLYSTLCRPHGIEDRHYRLDLNKGGLVDLTHLESQIDERTRAIIVNNPGNPTGAVLPKKHLEAILAIAHRYRVPIIADEIYGDMVYDGAVFHPLATLSPQVPIISCDGIAKRWLVPGWRLGWCTIHDRYGVLAEVRKGMVALSQKIVGPSALIQGALPAILRDTPQSFFDHTAAVLSANARVAMEELQDVEGLKPVRPHGAMYMMVGIDAEKLGEETPFIQGLIREESVTCLPGSAFGAPGWLRLVLTYPEEVTREACQRIREFCSRQTGVECSRDRRGSLPYDDESTTSSSDEGCDTWSTDSD